MRYPVASSIALSPALWAPFAGLSRAGRMPLPHPLDYDWRFTPSTVVLLWQLAGVRTAPKEPIILMGVPSIADDIDLRGSGRPVTLLERNAATVEALRSKGQVEVIVCDVARDTLPPIDATTIVADPPWYEADTISFLWSAAAMCRTRGIVMLSLPPLGTRPSIAGERARIGEAAAGFGLELVSVHPGILRYLTPFFEWNALRASGVIGPSLALRRGDLAIFARNGRAAGTPRPLAPDEGRWIEESLGRTRFRLREDVRAGFSDPVLRSMVANDVLPTVSKRDPRRAEVDVWTSGNRVFQCQGTSVLAAIIAAVRRGDSPQDAVVHHLGRDLSLEERHRVASATSQVVDVVKWEGAEFRDSGPEAGGRSKVGAGTARPVGLRRAV